MEAMEAMENFFHKMKKILDFIGKSTLPLLRGGLGGHSFMPMICAALNKQNITRLIYP